MVGSSELQNSARPTPTVQLVVKHGKDEIDFSSRCRSKRVGHLQRRSSEFLQSRLRHCQLQINCWQFISWPSSRSIEKSRPTTRRRFQFGSCKRRFLHHRIGFNCVPEKWTRIRSVEVGFDWVGLYWRYVASSSGIRRLEGIFAFLNGFSIRS